MIGTVVVAGHICLDIIPKFFGDADFRPGQLVEVGAADFATGGCVANVGRALNRLGVPVRLVARIGSDPLGRIILEILERDLADLTAGIVRAESDMTSYSVVLSPPGKDRTFLHMPGENNAFGSEDLHAEILAGARHFHFGYPPLMRRMFANNGEELEMLFRFARDHGCSTSLDLSFPDPDSDAGKADWIPILTRVLPLVDYFLPSDDELAFMTGIPAADAFQLCDWSLERGCAIAVIKRGEKGFVAKSAPEARMRRVAGLIEPMEWANRSTAMECFPARVVGTTGSGDATIAGFLMGIAKGFSYEECLTSAAAVGASCVEGADAISGIRSWEETSARLRTDWN